MHSQERGRGEDAHATEIVSVTQDMVRQRGKEVEKGRTKEEKKLSRRWKWKKKRKRGKKAQERERRDFSLLLKEERHGRAPFTHDGKFPSRKKEKGGEKKRKEEKEEEEEGKIRKNTISSSPYARTCGEKRKKTLSLTGADVSGERRKKKQEERERERDRRREGE